MQSKYWHDDVHNKCKSRGSSPPYVPGEEGRVRGGLNGQPQPSPGPGRPHSATLKVIRNLGIRELRGTAKINSPLGDAPQRNKQMSVMKTACSGRNSSRWPSFKCLLVCLYLKCSNSPLTQNKPQDHFLDLPTDRPSLTAEATLTPGLI